MRFEMVATLIGRLEMLAYNEDMYDAYKGLLISLMENLVLLVSLLTIWMVANVLIKWLANRWLKPVLLRAQIGSGRNERERTQRAKTVLGVVRATVLVILGALLLVQGLAKLGLQVGPLIAGAGIAGLAIGFGAQSLVKDVITGLFILIEDQFGIGDVVKIGVITGKVEDFNLRRTVLRDLEGAMHHIPNSQILTVSNLTKGWSGLNLLVSVGQEADLNKAVKVLEKEFSRMKADAELGPLLVSVPEVKGVEELSASGVKLQISARTVEGEQWKVRRAVLLRIKQAFDRAEITMG